MAKTVFTTSNALTKKAFEEKLYRDIVKESYFSRFSGTTPQNLVHEKTQLEKGQGDKITFGIRMRPTGAGVTSGQQLENNEESLSTYDSSVTLEQYRHAFRDNGAMDRQRAVFSISEEQEAAIKEWGSEKVDLLHFNALGIGAGATTDPSKIFYLSGAGGTLSATGTAATAKAALHASGSLINTSFISALKTWAKTGGNRTYVPLRPVKVDGKEYYILLVHPDCMYDLKQNSTFQNAQRDAQERGKDNPLFAGATAIWDGVVIHEHENCAIAADGGGGANVPWAKCAFMGAQALVTAWGKRPELINESFDYGNEMGVAIDMILKVGKPVFNSLDYGSLGVYLARTNISSL